MTRFVRNTYSICTAPRSGSFLLADGLAALRIAGNPQEYFDQSFEQQWREQLGIKTDAEYVPKLIARATTANGVCGAKVLWYQLKNLASHLGATDLSVAGMHAAVAEAFPNMRYISLVRRDRVAQAVSYYKAIKSDIWWTMNGSQRTPKAIPEFNASEIEYHRRLIFQYERGWQEYFRIAGVVPYTVVYEDFVPRYAEVIRNLLAYLQIPTPADLSIPEPRFARQADEESAEWVRRFRELLERGEVTMPAAPSQVSMSTSNQQPTFREQTR